MQPYVSYCPYCGNISYRDTFEEIIPFCKHCGSREPLINLSKGDTYEALNEEAEKVFGDNCGDNFFAVLEQKYHIKEDPRYNAEIADYIKKQFDKKCRQMKAEHAAERARQAEAAKPHCPTCGSTNIKKLDVIDRAVSVGTLGVLSNKINKSFKCKDCGYTW